MDIFARPAILLSASGGDILSRFAEEWQDFLKAFDPRLSSLLLRIAFILVLLLAFGCFMRARRPGFGDPTRGAQILAALAALLAGFAAPVDVAVHRLSPGSLALLLDLAIVVLLVLPAFLPAVLLRTRRHRPLLRGSLYIAETVLVIVQIFVVLGDGR